jgi:mRNA interferase MazF
VVKRGDICWVELPDEKRRPGLVLTRAEAIPVMRKVTVAYLTRTIRGIPSEVRLGTGDGMPGDCVISFDNVRTVSKAILSDPITSLAGKRMDEVCRALAIATGCR